MDRTVFQSSVEHRSARRFAMWLLLSALAVLFAAALLVVLIIRLQTDGWPKSLPPLPGTLWISTGLLLASGGSIQLSLMGIQRNRYRMFMFALISAMVLALCFLVMQTVAWFQWTQAIEEAGALLQTHQLARSTFLILTGLHAAHVIGGLIPLGVVCWYAMLRTYTSQDHVGVRDTVMYWHFLDAVWIVLIVFMLLML